MFKPLLLYFCFCSNVVWGQTLEWIATQDMSGETKVKSQLFGGISAITQNGEYWYAVSDDRTHPKVFKLKLSLDRDTQNKIQPKIEIIDVISLQPDGLKTLDFEGISFLPWGSLLLSTEGDNNRKPRQGPEIKEYKLSGEYVRSYEVPPEVLQNASGKLKKGIKNNSGFESLTQSPEGAQWLLLLERNLKQDPWGTIRAYTYESTEAWVLKKTEEAEYSLESHEKTHVLWGVSDAFWWQKSQLLVIERGVVMASPLEFETRVFLVQKKKGKLEKIKELMSSKKNKDLNFNMEGISWGPTLEGVRTLVLVSDNNLMRHIPSRFVFFKILESEN